ncbi:MAG: hypothetical protein ETSY1_31430 [Candidatus Entotheonella factor]|uniref:Copper resistance protein D domain-containing protein n=1 Tax=Entotheonella factor TaxID=1429438 RepID=W4LAY0_ENTF1|nr:hypothetical protein [Candidatus Entotheonella palauensis]ETW95238.1 MAG: hypothetical protein ETSY1_31430 [Candidatus Entotheonella factor]
MRHALDYFSTLLHLLGMLVFVGGHIWFGVLAALAEREPQPAGERFLAAALPVLANGFGLGVLLLFGSGLLKLLMWGEPGLIFLPDLYGWIFFSKLVLYIVIVGNGLMIERRYLPRVANLAGDEMNVAWAQVKSRARFNLVLVLVVVALGETMRFSKL